MRICDPRVRIVRDGHEPNEAEEQRPSRVPIEPVHMIFLAERPVEKLEGYQHSGSPGNQKCMVTKGLMRTRKSRQR
jgi:hypothetical protein